MSLGLVRRQFGYGVARLPIAPVAGCERLGDLACGAVPYERHVAALPGIACAAIAALLAWTTMLVPTRREPETSVVLVWQEPAEVARDRPEPGATPPSPPTPSPRIRPAPVAEAGREPGDSNIHADMNAHRPLRAFDDRMLLPPAPDAPIAGEANDARAVTEAGMAHRPQPRRERPGPRRTRPPDPALVLAAATETPSSHLLVEAGPRVGSSLPARAAISRPAVSAPAARPEIADALHRAQRREGGWQEVPLEALPDCIPSGRQDSLKQQILRTIGQQAECADAGGHFRFVEMRNLNAFLLWSRPDPEALPSRRRDRDACDVLERALRCLRVPQPNTEEISNR